MIIIRLKPRTINQGERLLVDCCKDAGVVGFCGVGDDAWSNDFWVRVDSNEGVPVASMEEVAVWVGGDLLVA
jgi:hypothetical protein